MVAVLPIYSLASDWSVEFDYSYASFYKTRDHREFEHEYVYNRTHSEYVPSISFSKAFLKNYELQIRLTRYEDISTDVTRTNPPRALVVQANSIRPTALSILRFRVKEEIDEHSLQLNRNLLIRNKLGISAGITISYLHSSYLKYIVTDPERDMVELLVNDVGSISDDDWTLGVQAKAFTPLSDRIDLSLGYRYTELFEIESHLTSLGIEIEL
ncbi:hypothetical protein [Pelagicoccus sp. SDUM812003]|uniref:hypothetical protein n=1 Tax=Pelagicoccus sp. SDUM812003 TaxID=3041267 RepID=UPI0028103DDA|nr:hypothetical protein [Pelagicoccus sp. SDUM812003]MDQ8205739.1 hypothetical protein [Pelagicoccus sp. SDUM812003]